MSGKLDLNPIIHAPLRLKICAFLNPLDEAEFILLREELDVSESVLSKHLAQLESAGYLSTRQAAVNGRARKWAALTRKGRMEFRSHVQTLRKIVGEG